MNFKFYFILLLIPILIFSGCSKAECSERSDCSSRKCFNVNCVEGECRYNIIDNCCGNGICEEGQDKCNCPEDCGPCDLPQTMNQNFFQTFCDENHDCSNDVKEDLSSIESVTINNQDLSGRDFKVNLKVEFNDPFNIKKDLMGIEIKTSHYPNIVENLKINRIQIVSTDRTPIVYADKEVNRMLWDEDSIIFEELFFSRSLNKPDNEINFNVVLHHEYDKISSRGVNKIMGSTTFNVRTGRDTLRVLEPDREYYCHDNDCYTDNPGLIGSCIEGTAFCEYTRVPNKCGNYICEANENSCNCPIDCGPCLGFIGDFLKLVCVDNECVSELYKSEETEYVYEIESAGRHFTLRAYTTIQEPHVLGEDFIKINYQLLRTGSAYQGPVVFTKIDLKTRGNVLLGSLNLNQNNVLTNINDQVTFSVPITRVFSGYYDKTDVIVEVYYKFNYIRSGEIEEMISSFSRTISNFNMVKVGE